MEHEGISPLEAVNQPEEAGRQRGVRSKSNAEILYRQPNGLLELGQLLHLVAKELREDVVVAFAGLPSAPFAPSDLPSSYPSCSPAATPPLPPHAALELEETRTTCGRAQAGDMCAIRLLCFPCVSWPEFYGQYCLSEMCC